MNDRLLGGFLVVWSTGFALVHAAWAAGWRAGVPDDQPPIAHRPVFLAVAGIVGSVLWHRRRRAVATVSE